MIPTYKLMKTLEELHPDKEIYFVIGSDLIPSLKRWDNGEEMHASTRFIVIPREGYTEIEDDLYPRNAVISEQGVNDENSTSSTEVRGIIQWQNIIHHSTCLKSKLGESVYEYILENNLFTS